MLNTAQLKHQAKILFDSVSFLTHIENESEYNAALELMDELIDDYDDQKPLIDLLSLAINEWEENSNEFKLFNHEIEKLDNGLSVLRVLIEQHGLNTTDFKEEIGGKSMVSMILNGKRKLSLEHIRALSKRFNVAPQVFI
ncbi:helix-turn-helix domain-containing protein [Thalassotalea crassostreae]|uniref:helix-turn-helix domain-containing protein n=1 Tax=Thalassotalea crassostreae TaxID=1763536 RepID=UPI000838EF74|nr:helix-turn-helix domain-containing protein [Thalassotalea crassostreae]